MNCPICKYPLKEYSSKIFKDHPSYSCENLFQDENEHYRKYFDADWGYSRYCETATYENYKIINYHNYREGKSDFGIIKKKKLIILNSKETCIYETVLKLKRCIPIPTAENFVNKIKTLIVIA